MGFVEVPAAHTTVGIDWQVLSSNDMDPLLQKRISGRPWKPKMLVSMRSTIASWNHTRVNHSA